VASDHGYVGIHQRLDLTPALDAFDGDGRVVVAPNGCAVLLYVDGQDTRQVERLARHARSVPGVGAMFSGSRGASVVDSTLPIADLRMDGPLAPDLLLTLSWSDEQNAYGHPGVSYEHGKNHASHGGASPWEIRNALMLQGPGLTGGLRSRAPSGNIDLAPTVLSMLGLAVPDSMTGRVLQEAMAHYESPTSTGGDRVKSWDEVSSDGTLRWSEYAGHRYLDSVQGPPLPDA
jgi:arylsulfatase A-like enzyme